tara:strand:+ start:132 stop:1034 length:903 start_codon:yes stop_codon:yes gene_type:complete
MLDFVNSGYTVSETIWNSVESQLPDDIKFSVGYEPTKMYGKRYVINRRKDEVIGIVGDKFNTVTHSKFFETVVTHAIQKVISLGISLHLLENMEVVCQTGRNNAFVMLQLIFPDWKYEITTRNHATDIAQRFIFLHGVDGLCSNQFFGGAIDMFCLNGQVLGDYEKVRRKNTIGFSIKNFGSEVQECIKSFNNNAIKLQKWADKTLDHVNVEEVVKKLLKSDNKAEKMYALYRQEVSNRGNNMFALYSALTNYSSYADTRNGFALRNTSGGRNDTHNMFKRELEVSKWTHSDTWKSLEVA